MREILAVEVSDTESEATYQNLFCSLKARAGSKVSNSWSQTTTRV
jgi:transposase-like protein